MSEDKKCDRDYCGFLTFLKEEGVSKNVRDVWLAYCCITENQHNCKRRDYFERNKKEPPANMSPTGRLL